MERLTRPYSREHFHAEAAALAGDDKRLCWHLEKRDHGLFGGVCWLEGYCHLQPREGACTEDLSLRVAVSFEECYQLPQLSFLPTDCERIATLASALPSFTFCDGSEEVQPTEHPKPLVSLRYVADIGQMMFVVHPCDTHKLLGGAAPPLSMAGESVIVRVLHAMTPFLSLGPQLIPQDHH